jgi:spore maturation protein CgeB
MKFVIFGLTMSSSWGNGHATLWRGLARALIGRGHEVTFFERDVPYYAQHRDYFELRGGNLVFYSNWDEVLPVAELETNEADVAMVTSYCPDGISASELVLHSKGALKTFYDLDTPVTLEAISSGKQLAYIGARGLRDFDLVLSYTGGAALTELQKQLGARRVAPLYGHVDPEVHTPATPREEFRCDFSYLGTYAEDRQEALRILFLEPARHLPHLRFLIGGAQYPMDFPWLDNLFFVRHIPPPDHPAFYCSGRITLNVTRRAMAKMGYCPSGRLFEAAACGVPLLSDVWQGLETFFEPSRELLTVNNTEEAEAALQLTDAELSRISSAARERTLADHTSERRAEYLEKILEQAWSGRATRDQSESTWTQPEHTQKTNQLMEV